MPQIGPLEIAIVLLIALLVFGPNRLPQMARQVGSALRELRRIQQHLTEDLRTMVNDESGAQAPPPTLPPLEAPAAGTGTDAAGAAGPADPAPTPGTGPADVPGAPDVPDTPDAPTA